MKGMKGAKSTGMSSTKMKISQKPKTKPGMAAASKAGTPGLKSALTMMSPASDGVRTVKMGRNSSKGFGKKIGM